MSSLELLETLEDFTSKENWDKFFTIRGADDAFEWYAEWPALRDPLLSQLSSIDPTTTTATATTAWSPPFPFRQPQILIPGCGSSRLSEQLYDAGLQGITNIDFSKVAISSMLRRNIRSRPDMRWRVMDMTNMQFADESFDVVIDKGGLDALMEPKLGSELGSKYLKEVKRVLKSKGIYVCLTLAESHVLGLLFSQFRLSWKTNVHAIPQKLAKKSNFQTFMFVFAKENSGTLEPIISSCDQSLEMSSDQGCILTLAIENENKARCEISSCDGALYSLEELKLGAKGELKKLIHGRRCQFVLGDQGTSQFDYKAVLLDSQDQSDAFLYHCGVFIVPKLRAREWLFSSEEGQWLVLKSSKAARLIMVFLDSRHSHSTIEEIQKDLSPLVMNLAPGGSNEKSPIPFLMASDGVKQREVVKKVVSAITGPIIVEDVIYENDGNSVSMNSLQPVVFRRLTFERSQGLVQSEALLKGENHWQSSLDGGDSMRKKISPKSRKKSSQKQSPITRTKSIIKVNHSHLASSYHCGILSGFMLIASSLLDAASSSKLVKTTIIGLGAGLFPMFLHSCLSFLDIEVVELDAVVFDVARNCFEFAEGNNLKVHIADGVRFIQNKNAVKSSEVESTKDLLETADGSHARTKILIIDADSSDISTGLTCPPADFLEEGFLFSAKDFLSEGGLFVINLVSRSPSIREMIISRMKSVFYHLFYLELEEDVNDVIFALVSKESINADCLPKMASQLRDLVAVTQEEMMNTIIGSTKKIRYLK